jgi:hypothetical protein
VNAMGGGDLDLHVRLISLMGGSDVRRSRPRR